LIFQDEMEIHLHPALTRMWAPVAQQPEVPAPGKNQKRVIYGGVDYKTGKLTYTVAETKCGGAFLAFLVVLLAAYVGKKILLVCDNGRFHAARAVQEWLAAHRNQIEVYWLPPYSPSLNLIERL
jgi:transposase